MNQKISDKVKVLSENNLSEVVGGNITVINGLIRPQTAQSASLHPIKLIINDQTYFSFIGDDLKPHWGYQNDKGDLFYTDTIPWPKDGKIAQYKDIDRNRDVFVECYNAHNLSERPL
jgi:hypothetical protein